MEPTDRSISPEATSIVIGSAIAATGRVLPIRKLMFRALPKPSTVLNGDGEQDHQQRADDGVPAQSADQRGRDPVTPNGGRGGGVSHW